MPSKDSRGVSSKNSKNFRYEAERCRVCKRKVQTMCFKGTGYCSQRCENTKES